MSKKSKRKIKPTDIKIGTVVASKKSSKKVHNAIVAVLLAFTIIGSALWFMNPPLVTKGDTEVTIPSTKSVHFQGKHVVAHLDTMTLELHDGSTTLAIYPIISLGKPGSYYETIGGVYKNDYKVPLHFSSIGHVYMPYSVHLFGNYFIHGIPYYPNGTQVSSTYSGGCIRLHNTDAKIVYDFIDQGTPVIVTRGKETDFNPTTPAPTTFMSNDIANLMVATISLEALTQDDVIIDTDSISKTTRKMLLPKLLIEKDEHVALLYANSIGQDAFVTLMNQKAEALGLSNVHFTDVTQPVATTYEDYEQFMSYITTYKSYLMKLKTEGR